MEVTRYEKREGKEREMREKGKDRKDGESHGEERRSEELCLST